MKNTIFTNNRALASLLKKGATSATLLLCFCMTACAPSEVEEEELDALMTSMDEIIASYAEYETQLAEIKAAEEAAVLVTIPVTLFNETDFTFHSLSLYEQGAIGR